MAAVWLSVKVSVNVPLRYRCKVVARPVPVTSNPRLALPVLGGVGKRVYVRKLQPPLTVLPRQLRREAEEQSRGGRAGRVVRAARSVDSQHGDVHVAGGIATGKDTGVAFAGGADVDQGAVGGVGQGQCY